jgi:hypothetical protein
MIEVSDRVPGERASLVVQADALMTIAIDDQTVILASERPVSGTDPATHPPM